MVGHQGGTGPRLVKAGELTYPADRQGMGVRWIVGPNPQGWTEPAFSEWELTGAGWTDFHPHSETNLILEGELHVECDGVTAVAAVGDIVTVPAGTQGRYLAPIYARMLGIYGPNPDAVASSGFRSWLIDPPAQ